MDGCLGIAIHLLLLVGGDLIRIPNTCASLCMIHVQTPGLLPHAGEYYEMIPRRPGNASSMFPFTGTSVMLALWPEREYKFEVMVFGGANEDASKNISMLAGG